MLVSLAGCLVKMGELDAAEDSYAVVAERVEQPDWRYTALEMLAHISALHGHRDIFEERAWRADEAGWREGGSVPVHAHILHFRAMSWRALGDRERARDYAQEHGINQVFFECEAALAALESGEAAPVTVSHDTAAGAAPVEPGLLVTELGEIRDGMSALRRGLAPAFA